MPDAVSQPPEWWTPADAAELDVLVWELVGGVLEHRERCTLDQPCRHIRAAIALVVEWKHGRELLSEARYLRHEIERQDIRRERALLRAAS